MADITQAHKSVSDRCVKDYHDALRQAERLESQGEIVIESERFHVLRYLVKHNHLVILAGPNGELSVDMDMLDGLIEEIQDIINVWKGW